MALKVTEAEIVDVLLGGADESVEARVMDAVSQDESAASVYRQWSEIIQVVRRESLSAQETVNRIREAVNRRVAHATPGQESADIGIGGAYETVNLHRKMRVRHLVMAAAATVLIVGGVLAALVYDKAVRTTTVLYADGRVFVREGEGQERRIGSDERLRFPVRIRTERDTSLFLRMPYGTSISTASTDVELELLGPHEVVQSAGQARYAVLSGQTHPVGFAVNVPQGRVLDLGTRFEVSVEKDKPTTISVTAGRVELTNRAGERVIAERQSHAQMWDDKIVLRPLYPERRQPDGTLLPPEDTFQSPAPLDPHEFDVALPVSEAPSK